MHEDPHAHAESDPTTQWINRRQALPVAGHWGEVGVVDDHVVSTEPEATPSVQIAPSGAAKEFPCLGGQLVGDHDDIVGGSPSLLGMAVSIKKRPNSICCDNAGGLDLDTDRVRRDLPEEGRTPILMTQRWHVIQIAQMPQYQGLRGLSSELLRAGSHSSYATRSVFVCCRTPNTLR